MAKSKTSKAKAKLAKRKRGGIPIWLYMTLSFVIPIYGFLSYFMLRDHDSSRAKIALFFATIGTFIVIILKIIAWVN